MFTEEHTSSGCSVLIYVHDKVDQLNMEKKKKVLVVTANRFGGVWSRVFNGKFYWT